VANELILVIEDNEQNRKLVRDVLTFKGYEIIEAETWEEGLRLAQARAPRLVLMDIRLPGINGIEALGQLRAEPATREIPVMAMTASVMTQDRQKIMEAGFDAYQGKPIKVKDFVAAVEQLLEHHENEGRLTQAKPLPRSMGLRAAKILQ
jgi:two-component system, cell cycle response regulator DivK